MPTILTSRSFNQDTGRAKKASSTGPVFITDRGKPSHVLLSIRDYRKFSEKGKSIADLLAMPGKTLGDLEIRISKELARSADLS
jgi:prevent-host-death family protein